MTLRLGRTVAIAVLLPAALVGCGATDATTTYDALPAGAWPTLEGVRVVSSNGSPGNSCCEPQSGGREVELAVTEATTNPRKFVASALLDTGWARCSRQADCVERDGVAAYLYEPTRQQRARGVDVSVWLERNS